MVKITQDIEDFLITIKHNIKSRVKKAYLIFRLGDNKIFGYLSIVN